MDFDDENKYSEPGGQVPSGGVSRRPAGSNSGKKVSGWKIFWGIITGLSVLANFMLLIVLFTTIVFFTAKRRADYGEKIIQSGPRNNKIMLIRLEGVIDSYQADDITEQIQNALEDPCIKSLILQITSPGGTVAGSDRIHNEISEFRKETGKPVVACRVGGIPEVIEDNISGILTPAENPRALAEAVCGLLSDAGKARTLAAAARERVRTHFSMESMMRRIEDLYVSSFHKKK